MELLPRERSEPKRFDEGLSLVPENTKEVHDVPINVIVRLYWRRISVQKNSSRATERLAVMMARRQERK
jgi:hypothetical protein